MKVTDRFSIRNRGIVTIVDHLVSGVNEGSYVKGRGNANYVWHVVGIEHFAIARDKIVGRGWPVGLLLVERSGLDVQPVNGEVLELVRE